MKGNNSNGYKNRQAKDIFIADQTHKLYMFLKGCGYCFL